MIKPTKYKSISTSQLKLRQVSPLNDTKKTKVFTILQKLSELIKLKHS
jgi:hypothetical protein